MTTKNNNNNVAEKNKPSFNWPVVSFLLFMTAIPAIPALFIMVMVASGASSGEGVSSIINAVYFESSAALFVHGGSGFLFFLTMPFQFSPRLRVSASKWHKTGGRLALLSGYIMGLSGIWMHHVLSPDSFGMRYISLVLMSLAMCAAFSLALWFILNGKVATHRRWMIRGIAITLAAITPLFIEPVLHLLFGQFEQIIPLVNQLQHDYGRLIAIAINLLIVELFILKRRNSNLIPQTV